MIYSLLEIVIKGGVYDKEDILNKIDFYLSIKKISIDQQEELMKLIK